jgi:hypothetical protein
MMKRLRIWLGFKLRRRSYQVSAWIFIMAMVLSYFSFFSQPHAYAQTFTTSGSWTVPAGTTSAILEAWGGGGAGGGGTSNNTAGGGGAGGQYAIKTLSVTVGNIYTVTVGGTTAGGTGNGSAGKDSQVTDPSSTVVVLAKGGAGGTANNGAGGSGSTASGIGDTVFAGGNGAAGSGSSGGGGGGAGSSGAGGNASGQTAGTGTATNGGNGGAGKPSGTNAVGNAGSNYGGGGGGAVKKNSNQSGGTGAQGLVVITPVTNSSPAAPTLSSPAPGATGVSTTPQFQLFTTDADSDYVDFEVQVCSTNTCSSVVYTACEVSGLPNTCTATSQTGWTGQDANSSLAYNTTSSTGTTATYTYQGATLTPSTQYWWRAYAIDPGGSNSASGASTIQSFTTGTSGPTADQVMRGGKYFTGGSEQPYYWAQ